MVDQLTPERRSWNMSRIRSKDTKPEMLVRSLLHRMGFRFRVHGVDLPGRPDIVLQKYRTVVFVNGCFWHQHPRCVEASRPKSSTKYWKAKLNRNVTRDRKNRHMLRQQGWRVLRFWECEIEKNPARIAMRVARVLGGRAAEAAVYVLPSRGKLLKAAGVRTGYKKLK